MARRPRLDLPGCYYHVFARGIEKRSIFFEKSDYKDFLKRLRIALEETDNECLVWALLPNHFHLLIRRGEKPLSDLMRKLMTGYSVSFNLKHQRVGHLFQNRYKAILCEKGSYLLELVRYIHLNPLHAGLAKNLEELASYPWCGHAVILGKAPNTFQAVQKVLELFNADPQKARTLYQQFLEESIKDTEKPFIEKSGGPNSSEISDPRILGSSEFVIKILEKREISQEKIIDRTKILNLLRKNFGVSREDMASPRRDRRLAEIRAIYCYLAKEYAMASGKSLEMDIKRSSGAVSQLIQKGQKFIKQNPAKLEEWTELLRY